MTEQEQRQASVFAHEGKRCLANAQHVFQKDFLTAAKGQMPQLVGRADAFAVADVVVAEHHVAKPRQKARERVVALDMLGHAVDQLHHTAPAVHRIG